MKLPLGSMLRVALTAVAVAAVARRRRARAPKERTLTLSLSTDDLDIVELALTTRVRRGARRARFVHAGEPDRARDGSPAAQETMTFDGHITW
jgi:hypothetical protein